MVLWGAPVATAIAAMMTAANLGARITGWGFVVFAIGSIWWALVGFSTGQTNLLATNGFLTIVNLVGIWRWLGRQRAYEAGGESAARASRRSASPSLFTASSIPGMAVEDVRGERIGSAVEALIERASGEISYVVVASGGIAGIDEILRAVPRKLLDLGSDRLKIALTDEEYARLPPLKQGEWPGEAPAPLSPAHKSH